MVQEGTIVVRLKGEFSLDSADLKNILSHPFSDVGTIFKTVKAGISAAYYSYNTCISPSDFRTANYREIYAFKQGFNHIDYLNDDWLKAFSVNISGNSVEYSRYLDVCDKYNILCNNSLSGNTMYYGVQYNSTDCGTKNWGLSFKSVDEFINLLEVMYDPIPGSPIVNKPEEFPEYWKIQRTPDNYEEINVYFNSLYKSRSFFETSGFIGLEEDRLPTSNARLLSKKCKEISIEQFRLITNKNQKDENSKSINEQKSESARGRAKEIPLGGYRRFHEGLFETKQEEAKEFRKRQRRVSTEVQYPSRATGLS